MSVAWLIVFSILLEDAAEHEQCSALPAQRSISVLVFQLMDSQQGDILLFHDTLCFIYTLYLKKCHCSDTYTTGL